MFPTGVSVLGDPQVAEGAMSEVVQFANQTSFMRRQSGLDHIYKTYLLENGGVTHVVENEYVRLVYVDVRGAITEESASRREEALFDRFYMDSGWVRGSQSGWVVDPTNSGLRLEATAAGSGTYAAIKDVVSRVFRPHYGQSRGASLGLDLDFSELADDERSATAEMYASLLNAKLSVPVGSSTGFMRSLLRGKLGRRLGEIAIEAPLPAPGPLPPMTVDGLSFVPGFAGVLYLADRFILVSLSQSEVRYAPLKLPREFAPILAEFRRLTDGGDDDSGGLNGADGGGDESGDRLRRIALATYLLSYAKQDGDWRSAPIGGMILPNTPDIVRGVWHFNYTRPECVATALSVSNASIEFTLQQLAFSADVTDEGIELFAEAKTDRYVYVRNAAPRLWVPSSGNNLELLPLLHNAAPPNIEQTPVYAFYDDKDELVLARAGCTSYTPNDNRTISETHVACGTGTSTFFWEQRSGDSRSARIEVGASSAEGGVTAHTNRQRTSASQSGATEVAGDRETGTGGCTAVFTGASATNGFGSAKPLIGSYSKHTETSLGSGVSSKELSGVFPYHYADAFFLTSRSITTGATSGIDTFTSNSHAGKKVYNIFGELVATVYQEVALSGASSGGGVPSTTTTTEWARRDDAVTSEAYVVTPFSRVLVAHDSDANTDIAVSRQVSTALDMFVTIGQPLPFVAIVAHSLHGEGYASISPHYDTVSFGGIAPPARLGNSELHLTPIGFQ